MFVAEDLIDAMDKEHMANIDLQKSVDIFAAIVQQLSIAFVQALTLLFVERYRRETALAIPLIENPTRNQRTIVVT